MSTPVKVAKMTPAADQQGVPLRGLMYLDDIPQAMDNMAGKSRRNSCAAGLLPNQHGQCRSMERRKYPNGTNSLQQTAT